MTEKIIPVPYYSQWESPNLANIFWENHLEVLNDPLWKNSGAKDHQEYHNWSWSLCGIACLKMALKFYFNLEIPSVATGKQAKDYGVYKIDKMAYENNDHIKAVGPMQYFPFAKFIKTRFGLLSQVKPSLSVKDIPNEIDRQNLVITSVHSSIRNPDLTPPRKGGHLVLVIGYCKNELIFHNPSGLPNFSQESYRMNVSTFDRCFANRGIILYKP